MFCGVGGCELSDFWFLEWFCLSNWNGVCVWFVLVCKFGDLFCFVMKC